MLHKGSEEKNNLTYYRSAALECALIAARTYATTNDQHFLELATWFNDDAIGWQLKIDERGILSP